MSVLQTMHDVIEMYGEVSVADLHEIMNYKIQDVEYKWGWKHLVGAAVRPDRGGWLLELPQPEPLGN